ncbi:MAG: hypothetical protein D3904_02640 [Candidatus Electrothrix sp. EH2]|nr:hypothetical protein [Candidatus Electrothrix sp. EH2]
MIKKIRLHNVATYQPNPVEIDTTQINYLYGGNGSGKTTLANVIVKPSEYPDCDLIWETDSIERQVYNKEFVQTHFSQDIKGIFTLGKGATEAKEFIEQAKSEIENHKSNLTALRTSFNTKETEEKEAQNRIIERCWTVKDKYNGHFREAYTGFLGSKKDFFEKCQREQSNKATLLCWCDIQNKCQRIFCNALKSYDQVPRLNIPNIASLEGDPILKTKIIAKSDVPMGALISRLNNSDWIQKGLGYLEHSESKCPFCQQLMMDTLKSEIEQVFDETYDRQKKQLDDFKEKYKNDVSLFIIQLEQIVEQDIEILDYSTLQNHIRILQEKYKNNLSIIDGKIGQPSIEIELNSMLTDIQKAHEYLDAYRDIIEKNNKTANNIVQEREKLNTEIWRFINDELSDDFSCYKKKISGIQKGKESIQKQIDDRGLKIKQLEHQIKEKEADITSIVHTKNEINNILKTFGFTSFSIDEADGGSYKIIRQNGQDAKETLSEGEYRFITFLYFYQLLKGNTDKSGVTTDKVVVIDDPISSLDSNVLFIVSNLIKEILKECRCKNNGIKQVFILTHNIYFHKEVTFRGREGTWKEESFWIIRNLNNQSNIIRHEDNPIQTTYELLWREIRSEEQINKVTIFNTLRRILEYYFKIIGGVNYEEFIDEFDGEEKIIFKSLCSWINDGSHFVNDDLVVYAESENIEKQLFVFKEIFHKMGHDSHYNMMMGREAV